METRSFRLTALILAVVASASALAVDYSESEPNDNFPPTFLPSNPIFNNGDRLVGSITANDLDLEYIRTAAAGPAGLYRYSFDLNSNGGDSYMSLYDASASGYYLGINDDRSATDPSSLISFDLFDKGGINTWGLDVEGFSSTDVFNYALTVTRTATPVTALGALSAGTTSRSFTATPGLAQWYSFTLGSAASISLSTLLSASGADTEIALFASDGTTLSGNDDISASDFRSSLSRSLAAGTYYVSVGQYNSYYNYDPTTSAAIGWDRSGFSSGVGSSTQSFTLSIGVTPVPEPTTLLALGGGAIALLRRRRRS